MQPRNSTGSSPVTKLTKAVLESKVQFITIFASIGKLCKLLLSIHKPREKNIYIYMYVYMYYLKLLFQQWKMHTELTNRQCLFEKLSFLDISQVIIITNILNKMQYIAITLQEQSSPNNIMINSKYPKNMWY